jgi:hypothetical protein
MVTMPIVGSISYVHDGRGDGIIVAGLAITSFILVLCRFWVGLWFTALLSLGVLSFTFAVLQRNIRAVREDLVGNPFAGLAETVSLSWGFAVIVVGAILLIAAASVPRRR